MGHLFSIDLSYRLSHLKVVRVHAMLFKEKNFKFFCPKSTGIIYNCGVTSNKLNINNNEERC